MCVRVRARAAQEKVATSNIIRNNQVQPSWAEHIWTISEFTLVKIHVVRINANGRKVSPLRIKDVINHMQVFENPYCSQFSAYF